MTGLYMDGFGLGVATVDHDKGRKARLTSSCWSPLGNENATAELLREQVGSTRRPVNLVMADQHYQLLLVEAPRVEPSELRAAVRWKVKNLIDFHIDDAVIDVFEIPGQQNRPAGQAMMYAIAARAREIRKRIDLCEAADLNLQVIDVTEMALRNLAAQLEEDVRGVGLLYLDRDHGIITVTRQANLYLSRRLEIGFDALAQSFDDAAAQITLEIQRSLDYYDSHFGQPALAALRVLPGFGQQAALVDALTDNLNLDTAVYDLAQAIDCQDHLADDAPPALLLAIGGALRREEISL
ncbi:MAG: hypothetical protein EA370_12940 [Wenzhouxiangella sp.]|nr:MAG: hypothetical protein EA370_12940 [Wenzhouxiangella sp.]